jgi:uncharacterized membrane protein (DUF485 family)
MNFGSLPGRVRERTNAFSFDPTTAKSVQDAERYRLTSELLLLVSALAVVVFYIAEIGSFKAFTDWLPEHLWTDSQTMQCVLGVASLVVFAFLTVFGFGGIFSLYAHRQYEGGRTVRTAFIWLSLALILPPLAMRDGWYLRVITISGLCYLIIRWVAGWAGNQRPHDWKIILAEMKRLNWGPLEFATALTKGKASDGHPLAFVSSDGATSSIFSEESGAPVKYERLTTLLTLTLKHRYPWSNVTANWQMLNASLAASGCTEAEREQLSSTWLYVHSEVEDRVGALIGPSCEKGFGPGVT